MYNEYVSGNASEFNAAVMHNCMIEGRKLETVPMGLLVQLGSIVDFNVPMLETVFEKIGTPYKYEQFADRLDRAKFWLEQCAPDQVNKLRATRNFDVWGELDDKEKAAIAELHKYLSGESYTLDELNAELYAIPKRIYPDVTDQKELKAIQGKFFKTVYKLLIDKEQGPRLYLFLYAIEKERFVGLLDFSYDETDEEKAINAKANEAPVVEEKVYGEPDPVAPINEEKVKIDDFAKLDIRVCKIVKCQEIRKSHSCYKLTLFDGIDERVIVSSIKHDYTTEELVGKKILVIANLEPTRITGVNSNGMLLAATNNACGCKVIFVDDSVPEGTQIH